MDVARQVRMHTGSDDALRVWVNGRLVTSVLKVRAATPDAEAAIVQLQKGDNTRVAELTQKAIDQQLPPKQILDEGLIAVLSTAKYF